MVNFGTLGFCALLVTRSALAAGPFLRKLNDTTHVLGNDLWNITIGQTFGTKLFYRNRDIIGDAVGHYVSYNGALSNLNWTSAGIHSQTHDVLDIVFAASEGDFHWVVDRDLTGAYQYFVNRALPVLGEFRSLFRLDNRTFISGKTAIKDALLPPLTEIANATKVQDETWQAADGSYITKYDFADFIRNQDYGYGVYGPDFGSWFIVPGKDDYNGNQLKQELLVHRESSTGDVVQLNMLHGTHFMASSADAFEPGKTWGPWLWYLNNGSKDDVASRAMKEQAAYPYPWFKNAAYQSRGFVSGNLRLSDGRPASHAAVFLGDNYPNETTLDMGRFHYYTTYADSNGSFSFKNVRSGSYGLEAWSNGGPIGDVSTTFHQNDVNVHKGNKTSLGNLVWKTQNRKAIWRIGSFDRKSLGFKFGGAPHQHALIEQCPADLNYTLGVSMESQFCFGQSALGSWNIAFDIDAALVRARSTAAVLTVSLAGYSSGVSSDILANGVMVGNLTSASIPSDPCLYRSATTAGEWHNFEFVIKDDILKIGRNELSFQVTRTTLWHGFMWDAISLEWA